MPSLVSLVMTVYNRQDYLSQALDSILAQTYPHWNLTIWDDGSTDSSPAIATAYAQLDPRICFIQGSHAGQTASLRGAIMTLEAHPTMISQINKTDVTICSAQAVRNALVRRGLSDSEALPWQVDIVCMLPLTVDLRSRTFDRYCQFENYTTFS